MTSSTERAIRKLDEQLPNRVSRPHDVRYAGAVSIWPKPTGPMPRAIVHCETREDVQAAVRAAREANIPLSVRGGGHDWAGRALCGGIVIDLRFMNDVAVCPNSQSALLLGGTRAAELVAVTDPLGLAAVTGSVGAVGMVGLALGGGYGPLIGRFGLALDNIIAAEVVLPDGRIVVAKHDSEPELFWALRGGGGNFGVVTAMHYLLHDLPRVHAGLLIYEFSEAKSVLERCAELSLSAPDELTIQVAFVAGPDGTPLVLVVPTWCGLARDGEARVAPFLKLGKLLAGSVNAMPYGASLGAFDPHILNGRRTFMETCWLPAIDSHSIEAFITAMSTAVSPGCAIVTHEFKGAAARVPVEATAFGLRRDHVLVEIIAQYVDRSDKAEERLHRQWTQDVWRSLQVLALPGGYPNLLARSEVDRASESYGGNAARLIQAKRRYDPDHVFSSTTPLPSAPGWMQPHHAAPSTESAGEIWG